MDSINQHLFFNGQKIKSHNIFPIPTSFIGHNVQLCHLQRIKINHVSYSPLTESCHFHVYVLWQDMYMVRRDLQRWNMQKQIDATRYIVPCICLAIRHIRGNDMIPLRGNMIRDFIFFCTLYNEKKNYFCNIKHFKGFLKKKSFKNDCFIGKI